MRRILPYLLFAFYKILQSTWRITIHETDEIKTWREASLPFVVAHWHGDEMGILHLLRTYHAACIISTSKDGDLMNRAVQLLGAETVRGSSTRGGTQALKGIIRLKNKGRRPSVAVDGPKGPIYQVKPGIFQISRLTGLPIASLSFFASREHTFQKAWNKSRLPMPFSKVIVQWGASMPAVSKESEARAPELALELKRNLNEAKKLAQLKAEKA